MSGAGDRHHLRRQTGSTPVRAAFVPACSTFSDASETMKVYLLSLGAGILVGVIYSLINVRSPAPPLVALLGLLGMLGGEQVIPVAKQLLGGTGLVAAWRTADCKNHMFGMLPGRQPNAQPERKLADSQENTRS